MTRAVGSGDRAAIYTAATACDRDAWNALLTRLPALALPYIEYRLRQSERWTTVPASAQRTLTRARDMAVATGLMRRHALTAAVGHLAHDGVSTVLLKGAAVATTLYPQFHLRPMADIDLWVRPEMLGKAVQCLLHHGFVASGPPAELIPPSLSQHRLIAPGSQIRVELHGSVRSLQSLSPHRVETCWTRAIETAHVPRPGRVLAPEDALLHTCLHLARSNGFAESHLGLLDVTLLVKRHRDQLDWGALARDAAVERVGAAVTLALYVAQDVWGADVPTEFFAATGHTSGLPPMRALALAQAWAPQTRLLPAMEAVFRGESGRTAFGILRSRVVRSGPNSPASSRRPSFGLTIRHIRYKSWRYLRAVTSGELTPREFLRRARLARDRGHLDRLLAAADRQIGNHWPPKAEILGTGVSITTYAELTEAIACAARDRRGGCVTALAVHGLVTAHDDPAFHAILDSFDAVAPDGQPVRLALNALADADLRDRVRGVDLAVAICDRAERDGLRMFLLGSRLSVVEALRKELLARFPHLNIVGVEPGVYSASDAVANAALIARIEGSGADVILVGMGCPHQERFAFAHRSSIGAVQVCVGSAFDVVSRTQPNAPVWVQRASLEWLFRLAHEPRRLWKRYRYTNSRFLFLFARALTARLIGSALRPRKFGHDRDCR